MKKLFVSLILIISLAGNSLAFAPLVLPAAISVAAHTLAIGGLVWAWWLKSNDTSVVDPAGNIKRKYDVTWVDTKDLTQPQLGAAKGKGNISHEDLKNGVMASDATKTRFPMLKDAIAGLEDPPDIDTLVPGQVSAMVGKKYRIGGTPYKVLGYDSPSSVIAAAPPMCTHGNVGVANGQLSVLVTLRKCNTNFTVNNTLQSNPNYYYSCQFWVRLEGTILEDKERSISDFVTKLNMDQGLSDGETIVFTDRYGAEIDDFIVSNPNLVHFDNDGNLTAPLTEQALKDALQGATSGNAPYVPTTPGQGGSGGSGGTSGSTGGNKPGTSGTVNPFKPYSSASTTSTNKENFGQTTMTAYGDARPNDVAGRISQFFTDLKSQPLLSFASKAAGTIPTTGQSTMSFNGGRFGNHTFDFSSLSGVFTVLNKLFMIITVFCCVRIISKTQ